MFEERLAALLRCIDDELDARLRASETARRALDAEHAALIAVIDQRGTYREDGHRSVTAYLRAACSYGAGEATKWKRYAEYCNHAPALGDALLAGHLGVSQLHEIGRIYTNPRTRPVFAEVAPVFLERARQVSCADLKDEISSFLNIADQDGAFEELTTRREHRSASIIDADRSLYMTGSGGDPLDVAEIVAVFDWFIEQEFAKDVAERTRLHGPDAPASLLARTAPQRRFDALVAMCRAARTNGADGTPIPVVLNVVADPTTLANAFTADQVAAQHPDGTTEMITIDKTTGRHVMNTAMWNPNTWATTMCHTANGATIHPTQLLQVALTGHIRRVLTDKRNNIINYGRKRRLFTGAARDAALLLAKRCKHPGCLVKAQHCQVDHQTEWHNGGQTNQTNAVAKCQTHNRFKHQHRWHTHTTEHRTILHTKPDGTHLLPVGAPPPYTPTPDRSPTDRTPTNHNPKTTQQTHP